MIAADGRQIELHQAIGGFPRQQRPGEDVAQIDDEIDAAPVDVGKHCLQRQQIAMNVRDGGDFQASASSLDSLR